MAGSWLLTAVFCHSGGRGLITPQPTVRTQRTQERSSHQLQTQRAEGSGAPVCPDIVPQTHQITVRIQKIPGVCPNGRRGFLFYSQLDSGVPSPVSAEGASVPPLDGISSAAAVLSPEDSSLFSLGTRLSHFFGCSLALRAIIARL